MYSPEYKQILKGDSAEDTVKVDTVAETEEDTVAETVEATDVETDDWTDEETIEDDSAFEE